MKYRAPLLLIEPFLEKIQLVTKSAKTSEYLKHKTKVIQEVGVIEDYYRELEKYIDGLVIDKKGNILGYVPGKMTKDIMINVINQALQKT